MVFLQALCGAISILQLYRAWKLLPIWKKTVVLWNEILFDLEANFKASFWICFCFFWKGCITTIMMNLLNYMIPIWFSNHTSAILGSEPGGCSTFDLWDQRSNHTGRVAGVIKPSENGLQSASHSWQNVSRLICLYIFVGLLWNIWIYRHTMH